jgi:hypothetical protein
VVFAQNDVELRIVDLVEHAHAPRRRYEFAQDLDTLPGEVFMGPEAS